MGKLYLIILTALATALPIHDSSATENDQDGGCGCFMGRTSPRCCSYFILDGAVLFRVAESNFRDGTEDFLITGELGYMFNRGPNWALGAGFYFGGDDDASRYGIRPRVRRWLNDKTVLDLSAGVVFAGEDNRVDIKPPGIAASASIGQANWVSFTVAIEALRIGPKEGWPDVLAPGSESVWRTGVYVGGTGSHWVAMALPVALTILVGATWD